MSGPRIRRDVHYICPVCQDRFEDEESAQACAASHVGDVRAEITFVCNDCGKRFQDVLTASGHFCYESALRRR